MTEQHVDFSTLDPNVAAKLEGFFNEGLCTERDIDEKAIEQLRDISPDDALDALNKVASALRTSNVRNFSAYLGGVIRRITQHPADGSVQATVADLHPEAQDVLERLYTIGAVKRGELDGRALAALAQKPPEMQILVMQTFRDRNLHGIRNMAAFFTSHQSQVERDLKEGRLSLPRRGGPHLGRGGYGGRGGRGRYPHPHNHHHGGDGGGRQGGGGGQYHRQYQDQMVGQPPPYQSYRSMSQAQPPRPYAPADLGAPPPAYAPAPGPGPAPASAPTLPRDYGAEQLQWGIRVNELNELSPFAKYVHPSAALRLQQLWDIDQNKLVTVMSPASWETLAGLDAANGTAAVNECAEAMKTAADDVNTINSIFLTIGSRYPKRPDAPTLATIALSAVSQLPRPAVTAMAAPPSGGYTNTAGPIPGGAPPAYQMPPPSRATWALSPC